MDELTDKQLTQLQAMLSGPAPSGDNLQLLAGALVFMFSCLIKHEIKQRAERPPEGKPRL